MYFSKKDVPLLDKSSESTHARQKNEEILLFCSHLIVPLLGKIKRKYSRSAKKMNKFFCFALT